jgi:hypothetical protein
MGVIALPAVRITCGVIIPGGRRPGLGLTWETGDARTLPSNWAAPNVSRLAMRTAS